MQGSTRILHAHLTRGEEATSQTTTNQKRKTDHEHSSRSRWEETEKKGRRIAIHRNANRQNGIEKGGKRKGEGGSSGLYKRY